MKKVRLLLAIFMATIIVGTARAGVVTTDQYKFLFDGVWTSTVPAGTVTVGTTTTAASTLFSAGSATTPSVSGNNVLFSASTTSAARGAAISNLNNGTALSVTKKEVLEFDWFVNSPVGDAMGYDAIGVSDGTSKPVFILMSEKWSSAGTTGYIHLMNLTPSKLTIGTTTSFVAATYTATSDYRTDCVNYFADSQIGADFTNNNTYHIKAKLDFSTHTIDSIWISRSAFVYVGTNIAFLSASATNLNLISGMAPRGKNQTNSGNASGSTTGLNQTIDNYYVYTWETASTTNVTVNYYDADSPSTLITSIVRGSQAIGNTYSATGADQASFTNSGNYCVYSSASLDNVSITGDGLAHVDLLMKKYPVTTATYQWTGVVDGTWNELNGNFTDGTNTLGYQPGNGVLFPESASNKTVTVNNNYSLGANDLTISGNAYTFQGTSTLTGTGKMNINLSGSQTVTLNINNNLTGVTQIAGGQVTAAKSGALGASINATGATTLIGGASITFPATTFGASSAIQGGTYGSSLINGMTASSGVKVSVSSSHYTANDYAMGFAASGTLSSGSELEFTGSVTENKFGMTSASTSYLANAKVTLKGNSFLYIESNQGAATTINVGTLAGDATSKLGWGRSSGLDRTITWSVGALNESSEFAGTITNTGGYNGGSNMYFGNYTNLTKVGTGILTLSGTSTGYNGNIAVNGGELRITGTVRGNNQATTPLANTVSVSGTTSILTITGSGSLTVTNVTVGAGSTLLIDASSSLTATNLTVAPGGKITLNPSGTLNVTTLTLQSDATGTGTFVDNGTSTITTANVQQFLTGASTRANWYLSSPVASATAAVFNVAALTNKLTYYDETVPGYAAQITSNATALTPGMGYVTYIGGADATYTFTGGNLNNGDITLTPTRTGIDAGKRGFNLVGNPYPSYLNWASADIVKTNVRSTIWYRTFSGTEMIFLTNDGTFGTGTSSAYIPPMQAFWIRVNADGDIASLKFVNSARAHQDQSIATNRLRAPKVNTAQIVRLQVSNGINNDEALIVADPNALDGFDNYDSQKMTNANVNIPEIFTLAGSEELVINRMNNLSGNKELPLGFRPGKTCNFTIEATEVSNFSNDMKVMLLDKLTGIEQELAVGSPYSFSSDATATNNRFSVLFKSPSVTTGLNNATNNQNVLVYRNLNNQITVICNQGIDDQSSVSVYNAVGQKLSNQKLAKTSTEINGAFTAGVYLVTVHNGGQTVTKKVIIK